MQPGRTILVVDDEPAIREMLEEVLADEGHRVVTAADGAAALDHLRSDGATLPCLILLDLMMPRMDGWQFAEELRADPELAEIPFALISANPAYASEADKLGAHRWLGKPLRLDDLLGTVEELCS